MNDGLTHRMCSVPCEQRPARNMVSEGILVTGGSVAFDPGACALRTKRTKCAFFLWLCSWQQGRIFLPIASEFYFADIKISDKSKE